ncbi:hypothetical protein KUA55_10100 [Enterococcus sp. ALS3]|uniref:Uncharacterized protein n=1 Tax=Enterococcus alishanensis TaxID=1303817 RepID=A0ABS6TDR5_9ENTE|nr:hypothetical protein [Enterococcus alishanensis]MBV7391034.1 hypothetical protein [Enterococcus alishanensis]
MMEDFIRKYLGDEYGDFYKNSNITTQNEIDISIINILSKRNSVKEINIAKEIVQSDNQLKLSYILEADLKSR